MKTFAWILAAGLSFGTISASPVMASEVMPSAQEVKFVSVRLVATNGGINPAYKAFNVVAKAEFSNECMIPEMMAKEVKYGPGNHREYRVLAVSHHKACPMVYMPVTREFIVDRIFPQESTPSIQVNDMKAE